MLINTDDGVKVEFKPRPIWEPYVEAVLARQRQEELPPPAAITSGRKTGLEPAKRTFVLVRRDDRVVVTRPR